MSWIESSSAAPRIHGLSNAERAHLSLLLGQASLGLSRYADFGPTTRPVFGWRDFRSPASSVGRGNRATRAECQTGPVPRWPPSREAPESDKTSLREAVLAFEALAESYFYLGEGLRTLYAAMSTLNLSERIGSSPELARGCATLAGIAGLFQLRKVSDHYSARALKILSDLDDPAAEIWVFILLGLSKLGKGEWEGSRTFLPRSSPRPTRLAIADVGAMASRTPPSPKLAVESGKRRSMDFLRCSPLPGKIETRDIWFWSTGNAPIAICNWAALMPSTAA